MQGLIDTHCHLDMLKAEIPEILSSAKEAGVEKVITISVDEKIAETCFGTEPELA